MNTNQTSAMIIAVSLIAFCFFMAGAALGDKTGKAALCAEQFKGEMHEGKCVLTTRVEITK
jgi:hypothetical protein